MRIRILLFLLVFCTACQSGLIPCPEARVVKLKKSYAKRSKAFDRAEVTASAKESVSENSTRDNLVRVRQTRPALEHVDVEEWDCPKPGVKKMPKAVKENIRKNTRKMKSHYKNRNEADSVSTIPAPSFIP